MTTKVLVSASKALTTTACCQAPVRYAVRRSCAVAAAAGQPCVTRLSYTTINLLAARSAAERHDAIRYRAAQRRAGVTGKAATARRVCCGRRCVLTLFVTEREACRQCSGSMIGRMLLYHVLQVRSGYELILLKLDWGTVVRNKPCDTVCMNARPSVSGARPPFHTAVVRQPATSALRRVRLCPYQPQA